MQLITLDLETYFDSEYSLKKLTTEEYVRDNRFKIHCVGYKIGDAPAQVSATLPLLDWANTAVICHHAQFDMFALSHWYGIRPRLIIDTLSMARMVWPHIRSHSLESLAAAIQSPRTKNVPYQLFMGKRDLDTETYQQVADGCATDVEITYEIAQKLLPLVPKEELKVIDLTIRFFTEPALKLDRPRMQKYLAETKDGKTRLLNELQVTKEDLQSSARFAELLLALGVEPPQKSSPANPNKLVYAFAKTDKSLKELEEHENPRVQMLVAARLGQKSTLGETRSQRLLDTDARGALPVYLKYCGAATTRWSGGDKVNWQNFTRGGEIRKSIIAPDGFVLAVGDLSQIECRMLNWLAGQEDVLDKFRKNEDIYSELATRFYNEKVDKSKPEKRGTGKQIELSCGFRAGADSIKETARKGTYGPPVHLTDAQAMAARNLYRETHGRVVEFWQYCDKVLLPALVAGDKDFTYGAIRAMGKNIFMPNGNRLNYDNLHYSATHEVFNRKYADGYYMMKRVGPTNMHGGILTQNIIEALSRLVLSQAMLKVAERYKIVMCTHDELVALVPEGEADEGQKFILDTLKTPPAWCMNIPLDAEGGYARNYSK